MGWTGRIDARRQIAATRQDVNHFLADLENHARLSPGSVEVLSHHSLKDGVAHATVLLRGPLGIRRFARTELLPVPVEATSIRGRAQIGHRTAASVAWTIKACGPGRSEVALCARVEDAAPLDRLLLLLGGRRWLAGHFQAALARLPHLIATTDRAVAASTRSPSPVDGLTKRPAASADCHVSGVPPERYAEESTRGRRQIAPAAPTSSRMKAAGLPLGRRFAAGLAAVGLLVAASLFVAACGGGSNSNEPRATAWNLPNANLQNTRSVGGLINRSNVSTLGVAWTVPITASGAFGGYSSTPVVADGVMYAQDIDSNVQAIDLESGEVVWTHKYDSTSVGPNGLSVVDGTVYGATGDSVFALEASSGDQLWIKKLTRNANEGIDMPPGVHDGTVYVSTVPGNAKAFYAGSGQAVLWAMDASTGETKWRWAEVPANLWSDKYAHLNSGGGQWYPPTFDGHGNLYVGVSNPAPFPGVKAGAKSLPWGSSRPGPDLYTDSIVKLDEQTGKVIWHYQLTPHDIYDYDLENSPILSEANGRQIVIDGGKAGILVAVDAKTGKPIWKREVGVHNGHQNDNIAALHGDFSKLHAPVTIEPGDLGGIESPIASDGKTVYAAVNNLPSHYASSDGGLSAVSFAPPSTGTGDLVAVDEATGKVKWDRRLPSSPYGAATITNGVVFTTTYDGTLYAFNSDTGDQLWRTKLSAGTNAPVAVFGDTVVTAGSLPGGPGQKAQIIAYRLGSKNTLASLAARAAPPTTTTSTAPTTTSGPSKGATPAGTLDLGALDDQLAFTTDQLTANAGRVSVDFTNNSALPHDVVLIDQQNKILGQTPVFQGGAKSFTTTLSPGTYTYYCSVPGHRQAGMQGTLTVR
jgi:outer membrane protein assembly factor BamB